MNARKPLLVDRSSRQHPGIMYHFMITYIGDINPEIEQWANQVTDQFKGRRLGGSHCLLSGSRTIQFGFEFYENARLAKDRFDHADRPGQSDHYEVETSNVTDKGWVYPPPVIPMIRPHRLSSQRHKSIKL